MTSFVDALVLQASAALRQGDLAAAERHATHILEAAPDHAEAHNLLAVVCARRNDPAGSINRLRTAQRLAPASYAYARNLVVLLCRGGHLGEADQVFAAFASASTAENDVAGLKALIDRQRGIGEADHKAAFEEIYRSNAWGAGSGLGSLSDATYAYRDYLQSFLAMNNVRSVLDIGCGDWQFSQHIDWGTIDYLGVDVSETALARARAHERANIAFRLMDATRDDLPAVDLVILKDVMQHWPNAAIDAFLPKLARCRWALITNRQIPNDPTINADIALGNVRSIDLMRAPFLLCGAHVFRFVADEAKSVFLWSRTERHA